MAADLFETVAEEYKQLANDMGEPLIDVMQSPKLRIGRLELVVSGNASATAGEQPNVAMLVADDFAAAMRVAYHKAPPNLKAISGNFQTVETKDGWFVAYVAGGGTKLLFEIKAGAVDETSPNNHRVTVKLLESAWQKGYVPGCVEKYSLWSALTAYALRLKNRV